MTDFRIPPDFVASIYEAALSPDGLMPLAQAIGRVLDVENVGLWTTQDGGIIDLTLSSSLIASQASYLDYYYKIDVWQGTAVSRRGNVVLGTDAIADRDLKRTKFYNDFARHYGFTNPMGASIDLGADRAMSIALDRLSPRLAFTPTDKAPLQALLPHLTHALQLRQRMQPWLAPPQAHGLDALAFGAVICDAKGAVVYVNAAAEDIARASTSIVLRPRGRTIAAVVARESRQLGILLHTAASQGGAGNMIVSTDDGTPSLIVLVTPIPMTKSSEKIGPGHALVAFRPIDAAPAFDAARLMQLFRLSPAQADIAVALYEGRSFEEIAVARRVKVSTLRTHFAEVLNRTGAKGLRDLTRLLGMIPPLR